MKISVIVPVYKAEKYLNQCIDSILNQTYQDFELILVDDGSPDSCPQICDGYAVKDNRIKVIHTVNGGPMAASKEGLKYAIGEFVGFIDSDDFIELDYLETMVNALKADTDIVSMHFTRYWDNGRKEQLRLFTLSAGEYDVDDNILTKYIDGSNRLLSINRVGKLIRSEIVKKYAEFCSDKIKIGEDWQLYVGVVYGSKKIILLDEYKYFYRYNPQSLISSYKSDFWENTLILFDSIEKFPDVNTIKNFQFQINNEFLYFVCYCLKNEYESGKLNKAYFKLIVQNSRTKEALENYNCENFSRLNKLIIKAISSNSYLKLKNSFFIYEIYRKFRK